MITALPQITQMNDRMQRDREKKTVANYEVLVQHLLGAVFFKLI
jgi:hypothetical protein